MSTTLASPPEPATDALQLVVFRLGDEDYGVPISTVQEIIRHTPPRPIPGGAHGVEGVINLRGALIPVVALRARLGSPGPSPAESKVVIVDLPDVTVGLQVDEVTEVLTIDGSVVVPPPSGLAAGPEGVLAAVAKLDDRLLVILDPSELLAGDAHG